jgi:tight adherence protein B
MMDSMAAIIAGEVTGGLFLLLFVIGRAARARYTVVRHTRRFLREPPATAREAQALERNRLLRVVDSLVMSVLASRQSIGVALGVLVLFVGGTLVRGWPLGIVLAAGLLLGLRWQSHRARAAHRAELERQLVPVLRTIATAVESGLSFAQALDRVVHDSPVPIADEFAQVLRSIDLGMPLPVALQELATRTGSSDFEFFASIVTVQYRTGGSLARLLGTLAENIQERLEFATEVGALTAQARFSGWVLAALPFGVLGLLLVASPSYVSPLLNTTDGRLLLGFAGVLLGVGLYTIRSISYVRI